MFDVEVLLVAFLNLFFYAYFCEFSYVLRLKGIKLI